jgi:hypothetical protein
MFGDVIAVRQMIPKKVWTREGRKRSKKKQGGLPKRRHGE